MPALRMRSTFAGLDLGVGALQRVSLGLAEPRDRGPRRLDPQARAALLYGHMFPNEAEDQQAMIRLQQALIG